MPDSPRSAVPARVPRRTVLLGGAGGLAGLLALGACDGSGVAPIGSPSLSPTAPAADADTTLLDALAAPLGAALSAAGAAAVVPGLQGVAADLDSLHRKHAGELGLELPATTATPAPPASPAAPAGDAAALRQGLATAEEALQTALVESSVTARSGALAQLLASMAAAVAQRRTALA